MLTATRPRMLALSFALLSLCGSPEGTVTNRTPRETLSESRSSVAEPIEELKKHVSQQSGEYIEAFVAGLPPTIPPTAVAYATVIDNASLKGVVESRGGTVHPRLVVFNAGPKIASLRVVCVSNAEPQDCSEQNAVIDVALEQNTGFYIDLRMRARPGDRIDILALPSGDLERPNPTAQSLRLWVDHQGSPPPGEDIARARRHSEVLGGCDFVTLLPSARPQGTFRPPGAHLESDPLFVVVETCDGGEVVQLIGILDRAEVVTLPGVPNRPFVVAGQTFAAKISSLDYYLGRELVVVALRLGPDRLPSAWVSHPAHVVSG